MRGYTNVAASQYHPKGGGGRALQKLAFPLRALAGLESNLFGSVACGRSGHWVGDIRAHCVG